MRRLRINPLTQHEFDKYASKILAVENDMRMSLVFQYDSFGQFKIKLVCTVKLSNE